MDWPETFLVSLGRLVRHLQSSDKAGFYRLRWPHGTGPPSGASNGV